MQVSLRLFFLLSWINRLEALIINQIPREILKKLSWFSSFTIYIMDKIKNLDRLKIMNLFQEYLNNYPNIYKYEPFLTEKCFKTSS